MEISGPTARPVMAIRLGKGCISISIAATFGITAWTSDHCPALAEVAALARPERPARWDLPAPMALTDQMAMPALPACKVRRASPAHPARPARKVSKAFPAMMVLTDRMALTASAFKDRRASPAHRVHRALPARKAFKVRRAHRVTMDQTDLTAM